MMAERRNLAMFTEKILLLVNREGSADGIYRLLLLKVIQYRYTNYTPSGNDPAEALPRQRRRITGREDLFPRQIVNQELSRHVSVVCPLKCLLPRQKLCNFFHDYIRKFLFPINAILIPAENI